VALGYCMVCETLRSIRPGPQKWGSRERAWYPNTHHIDLHCACGQIVVYLNEDQTEVECTRCGPISRHAVDVGVRCPGEKREIK
jgi:hypothetical protein